MLYCEECRKEKDYPHSSLKMVTECKICKTFTECNVIGNELLKCLIEMKKEK
jgi:hypothetical protein